MKPPTSLDSMFLKGSVIPYLRRCWMPRGNTETYSERYHDSDRSRNKFLEVCFFQKARYQTLGGVLFGGLGRNDNKQFLTATMHSEGEFNAYPPPKTKVAIWKSPCSIGNTSSKGPCSIAMLVFGRVNFHEPSTNNVTHIERFAKHHWRLVHSCEPWQCFRHIMGRRAVFLKKWRNCTIWSTNKSLAEKCPSFPVNIIKN